MRCPHGMSDERTEPSNKRRRSDGVEAVPEERCNWVGSFKDFKNHDDVCDFKIISCAVDGCNHECRRKDMSTHLSFHGHMDMMKLSIIDNYEKHLLDMSDKMEQKMKEMQQKMEEKDRKRQCEILELKSSRKRENADMMNKIFLMEKKMDLMQQKIAEFEVITNLDENVKQTSSLQKMNQMNSNQEEKSKKQPDANRLADVTNRAGSEHRQRIAATRSARARDARGKITATSSAKEPAVLNNEVFETILLMHTDTTFNLLVGSAARGEASVPVEAMTSARNLTLTHMNNSSGQFLNYDVVKTNMSKAENAAIKKYNEYQKNAKKK